MDICGYHCQRITFNLHPQLTDIIATIFVGSVGSHYETLYTNSREPTKQSGTSKTLASAVAFTHNLKSQVAQNSRLLYPEVAHC